MELDKIILKKFFFGNSYQIEKSLLDILELYNAKNLNVSLNKITFQGPSSIKTLITHPLVGIKEGCIKIQDNYLLIKLSVPDLLIGFYTVVVFMVAIFFMFLYLDAVPRQEKFPQLATGNFLDLTEYIAPCKGGEVPQVNLRNFRRSTP